MANTLIPDRPASGLSPAAFRWRILLLLALGVVALGIVLSLEPIPQPSAFHNFADARTLLGVPNLFNVLSNAPFLVIGVLGLHFVLSREAIQAGGPFIDPRERWPYVVLFMGVALTAFGSGYYHLHPDTPRLFWDRLPMTVIFRGLVASVVAERISVRVGLWLLGPLVVLGIGSAVYWLWSELRGQGDLRLYLFVQFYPLLILPIILLLFPSRYTHGADWFVSLGWYALAKVLEEADRLVYALGHVVSGHTLKHLAAALSTYWVLRMLWARRPILQERGQDL